MTRTHKLERFESLYRRHAPAVHAYVLRRSDRSTAEEVVAEVFLVAWRRWAEVPQDALPWLIGVARNRLAQEARAAGRRRALAERMAATTPRDSGDPGIGHLDPRLARALGALPERDRELLCLLAWERLTPDEAAASLGCSRAALRVRLHRARRRLRRLLSDGAEPRAGTTETNPAGELP